ncbi:DUF502 domain-containing protein [Jannaschia rubra]|uniref:DUF502 domain-containing protein n=1 Tax=Jannaschia rubra TaxID=282197 RepID=A0A0M6XLP0_9RHOB|nr:DUF502 domain-containing protein [Jannaschia rubra]CTQ32009.1 hypothetical protein JAN5088_00768 [Jannaschia rubra]SFG39962.1 Uncharacterized membrane protein [Jannaschia rubra]
MNLGDETPPRHSRPRPFARLRNSFLTGLIVIAPIGLTFWLIWSVIGWIDSWVLPFVPVAYRPDILLLRHFDIDLDIRGIGVAFFLVFTLLVGWAAKGLIGRSILRYAENLVQTMPIVRSVYGGLKQIAETILAQDQSSFEQACLVEYPRRGIWAIGFVSTAARGEIARRAESPMLSVFLPTTPNPTSGFLLFVPADDVVMLDMSVEDAAKLVISAGLVYPNGKGQGDPIPDLAPPA